MSIQSLGKISQFPDLIRIINKELKETPNPLVLDYACKRGVLGYMIKALRPEIRLHGCDVDMPENLPLWDHYELVVSMKKLNDLDESVEVNPIYDLIICVNDLALMPVQHAERVVYQLKEMSKRVLITLPNPRKEQSYGSNESKAHKWPASDKLLRRWNFERMKKIKEPMVYMWKDNQ